MGKRERRLILIFFGLVAIFYLACSKEKPILFESQLDNIILEIATIAPNGTYLVVNVKKDTIYTSNMPYGSPLPHVSERIAVDTKNNEYWHLMDDYIAETTILHQVDNFAWDKNSKMALCSAALRNFPIFSVNFETRIYNDLNVPWLGASGYRIPIYSYREHEIIFFTRGIDVDTVLDTCTIVGRVAWWDTLTKKTTKIYSDTKLANINWMILCDTNSIILETDGHLLSYSAITNSISSLLRDIKIEADIRISNGKLVFIGSSIDNRRKKSLYVYDIVKKSVDYIQDAIPQKVFYADVNKNHRYVLWTGLVGDQQIYLYSKDGRRITSFKGLTPFWLAGSDTLIYSEGKLIVKAWLDEDNRLHKTVVLKNVKK